MARTIDRLKGLDYICENNEQYLVYSFEHDGFWCEEFLGTTPVIDEAGLFEKAVAIDHVVEANESTDGLMLNEMAVPRDRFNKTVYNPSAI